MFWRKQALREGKTVYVITRLDCVSRYRLRDKVHGVVGEAEVSWHTPYAEKHRHAMPQDG